MNTYPDTILVSAYVFIKYAAKRAVWQKNQCFALVAHTSTLGSGRSCVFMVVKYGMVGHELIPKFAKK